MAHRYRLYPAGEQEAMLERHCGDAGYVWNLALEQFNCWRPGRRSVPGPGERFRQLADARQGAFLGEGSSSVQQRALRDLDRRCGVSSPAPTGGPGGGNAAAMGGSVSGMSPSGS